MVILRSESSTGAPYLGDGHVGAYGSGSRVPDDELATRLNLYPLPRIIGVSRERIYTAFHTHPQWRPADDVREETSAALQRTLANGPIRPLIRTAIHTHPLGQPAGEDSIAALQEFHAHGGWLDMPTTEGGTLVYFADPVTHVIVGGARGGMSTTEGVTLLYGNAGGGSSVHVASRPAYAFLAPGGEFYVAAGAVTHSARGGGPIQPFLQSYPMGALGTRAPQSSQDGVAGDLTLVADAFLMGCGEAPYLGGGTLADGYPARDGGTPYLPRGALPVIDVFPDIDGGTPYLARGVLPVFPARDGGTPYFARGALPVADVFPEIGGGTPYLARGALIPSVGGGGNARNQHVFVDMPPSPPDATTGTTDQARKFLERLLFGLLPACVVALGPLTGAPDGTKLAIYVIMAVLIVLLVIGISTRAYAAHVVRLATCAGIFAMTLLVSIQFSRGIYVAIAALVGVALTGITLAL